MMKMFFGTCIALVISLSVSVVPAIAGQAESLKGITSFGLLTEKLKADIEKDGLTRDQIISDVQLKLQRAGIDLIPEEEFRQDDFAPYLYVKLTTLNLDCPTGYLYSLDVAFCQVVTLKDSKVPYIATTWIISSIGTSPVEDLIDIRAKVNDKVEHFLKDYLLVNPKK